MKDCNSKVFNFNLIGKIEIERFGMWRNCKEAIIELLDIVRIRNFVVNCSINNN